MKPFLSDNIYFAAKDGMPLVIYSLLSSVEEHVRAAAINNLYQDTDDQYYTPLTIAARNGHYHSVVMLLKYLPSLEQECTVNYEHSIIQGATALWCAAGSGHLRIVKTLVLHGADVNHQTKNQSTPLRAACFEGRLDIVQYLVANKAEINLANGYNNTCLMVSAYKGHTDIVEFLLHNGAKPDDQAHCGATALHYAAEYGHCDICESLLNYGASLKTNCYGMTAVITAAERTRELVVDLFYNRPHLLTIEEKIDALELIGASFANDKDNYSITKAYYYLMTAMELRYSDPNNIIRKKILPPVPAYDNWIECQTIPDLQAIRYNNNSIHMEALTIRERILTRKCPDVAHPIIYRGAVCADNGRFDRCESLWLHALYLRQDNTLSVQRDLLRFAQVFSQMIQLGVELRLQNILSVLQTCIKELEINTYAMEHPETKDDVPSIKKEYELNIITSLYLCTIMTTLLKDKEKHKIDETDVIACYRLVYKLNKMKLRLYDGQTLLHLAVSGVTPIDKFHINDVCRFPCVDTVKLLLICGADVTEVDFIRNSPLHTLIATQPTSNEEHAAELFDIIVDITELFIRAGLHMDSVNEYGLTAAHESKSPIITSLIKRFEVKTSTLKCLASKCIAKYRIPYKNLIPICLESFIQQHMGFK